MPYADQSFISPFGNSQISIDRSGSTGRENKMAMTIGNQEQWVVN